MNASIIASYLDKRTIEIGWCGLYAVRMKHFIVHPSEKLKIHAYNQLFILLDEVQDTRIESETGVYDTSTQNTTTEQQHEHYGQIIIRNLASDCTAHVKFIQAIPLSVNKPCCKEE